MTSDEHNRIAAKLNGYIDRIEAALNLIPVDKDIAPEDRISAQRMYRAIKTDLAADYREYEERKQRDKVSILELAYYEPAIGNALSSLIYSSNVNSNEPRAEIQPSERVRIAIPLAEARHEINRCLRQLEAYRHD